MPAARPRSVRHNPRRQEEQQFLRRGAHVGPFKQISDNRQAAYDRYFGNRHLLLSDNHAADNYRSAILHRYFSLGRLSVQRRNALNSRNTIVDLSILDDYVHE